MPSFEVSSLEVCWNGGPLLPPRPERTATIYSDAPGERKPLPSVIFTGRFCGCGCGQELVYSRKTNRGKRANLFRPGHVNRMKVYEPRDCKRCGESFTPQVGASLGGFCTRRCQSAHHRERRRKIKESNA